MKEIKQADRLVNAKYEIRGKIHEEAKKMIDAGEKIIRLNTGNPPVFDLNAPIGMIEYLKQNIHIAEAYQDGRGLLEAREAVVKDAIAKGFPSNITPNDVFLGNGLSEFIFITMECLINPGDEFLIPMPFYPLWNAAIVMYGGTPVYYTCDESNNWNPNVDEIRSKISAKTKGILLINPNNPTGAVYSRETLEEIAKIAAEKEIIVFADEIYELITYDDAKHIPFASVAKDKVCVISMGGLSKSHNVPGFRSAWIIVSGKAEYAKDYIAGIAKRTTMQLCANVPAQVIIPYALAHKEEINACCKPGGRLYEQVKIASEGINKINGLSAVKGRGAMYIFPKIDHNIIPIKDDRQMAMDILKQQKILLVQGIGFGWEGNDHFRLVCLTAPEEMKVVVQRLGEFFSSYKQ